MLDAMRAAPEQRTDGVISEKRRRHYQHAALLVGCVIEVDPASVGYRGAIKAFAKCAGEEVGCAFGLALARLRAFGPSADVGEPLLLGFAANRYVAPMLLGERWERLDAFRGEGGPSQMAFQATSLASEAWNVLGA